jgi:hypothetical protein
MNKRIFELARQADLIQWDTLSSGAKTPDHASVVKAQKFAQLIAQDCAKMLDEDSYIVPELGGYAYDMRKRYGVEE